MPVIIDAQTVCSLLTYDLCISAIRRVMPRLSAGETLQLPRGVLPLEKHLLGVMTGAASIDGIFGAKIVSVTEDTSRPGRQVHRGIVIMFDGDSGIPVCIADAEELTLIRTAAASAVATDALASRSASSLGIFGCGAQAGAHIAAIARVRSLNRISVWSRSYERASAFADAMSASSGLPVVATARPHEAAGAEILCTVTTASEPVLRGDWVNPGSHVNLVGSSRRGRCEVDRTLVLRSRYFADSRASVMVEGAEFLEALEAQAIALDHFAGEIGDVIAGRTAGRQSASEITLYKSVGHIVQDLAAIQDIYELIGKD